jgi:hypothetical protein
MAREVRLDPRSLNSGRMGWAALWLIVSLLMLFPGGFLRRWWPESLVQEAGAVGFFSWFLYQILLHIFTPYRCPSCGDRLKESIHINSRAPGDRDYGGPIHYVCPRCDVEWDTGSEWSDRGD